VALRHRPRVVRQRVPASVRAAGILIALAALVLASCSSDTKSSSSGASASTSPGASEAVERAAAGGSPGPAADLSQELTIPGSPFMGSPAGDVLGGTDYEQHEYVAAGTATSYKAEGALGADGRWNFVPDTQAPYRTRVLVRRPSKADRFNGTVVVEWLNVSGGVDADPDWATLHEELLRSGAAWVGVSAQIIGVEGGPVLVSAPGGQGIAGKGLKGISPARYGSLSHPGDGYSFDMYTQVARAVGNGGPAMGGLMPQRVIAIGESQSAFALVTYVNGVQPLAKAFDGFFVHSRGAVGLPLVGPGMSADLAAALGGTASIFRTDIDVPILDVQTESDVTSVLNSQAARQPDSDRFRLWEVAGTAHADAHLVGPTVATRSCGVPINNGPLHVVAKAAFRALDTWIRTGQAPPNAERLVLTGPPDPTIQRDADGIATGGIRTPPVDVPVDVLSGVPGPEPSTLCLLLGSTIPLPADRLAALYSSRADYQRRYDGAVDETIRAGFALADDRAALEGYEQPGRIGG
jgi:Alpha/beta hydrolase domain